jgi:hypothetical protein
VAFRDKSVSDALQLGVGFGGSIVVVGAFAALGGLMNLLLRVGKDRRVPLAASAVAVLTGGALWAMSRKGSASQPQSAGPPRAPSDTREFLRAMVASISEKIEAGVIAQDKIGTVLRSQTPTRPARDYAARTLSRSAAPAQLAWLAERMQAEGYVSHHPPLVRSVERRLRVHPRLFVRYLGDRWGLRSWPPITPTK